MQVEHGWRDRGLGQHVMDLAAVVRLVIEEMRHQHRNRIIEDAAFVVPVLDRPLQEFLRKGVGEGDDTVIIIAPWY